MPFMTFIQSSVHSGTKTWKVDGGQLLSSRLCGAVRFTSRVLERRVEEVLVVAFHAEDGGVDEVEMGASELEDAGFDAIDGELAGGGVANDAALADVEAACFELRFDEDDDLAVPPGLRRGKRGQDGGEDEGGGDEGDVHGDEGGGGSVRYEEFAGGEEAGVGAFAEGDAGVVAELLGI